MTSADPRASATVVRDELPTCACGHDRHHPLVEVEPVLGGLAFLLGTLLGMGGARPKSVRFRCSRCGQVVEESNHLEVRERHR